MGFMEYFPVLLNNIWLYGILVIAVITFVIFIHELGHYLAARWMGVRPEMFSIGFGRELIGRTDTFGTRWSLRLYPFGGYVRMYGDAPHPELLAEPSEELKWAFFNKSVSKRAFITAAGPAMNFIFCVVLLACVYMTLGRPSPPLIIVALGENAPAMKAGMKIGDEVLSIDGKELNAFELLKAYVADKAGTLIKVEVKRGNEILHFDVTPNEIKEKNFYGFETTRGSMRAIFPNYGLDIKQIHKVGTIDTRNKPDLVRKTILQNVDQNMVIVFGKDREESYFIHVRADLNQGLLNEDDIDYGTLVLGQKSTESMKSIGPVQAFREAADLSWDGINSVLGSLFKVITGTQGVKELGGVIKISTMTGDVAERGIYTFLKFVALLSLSIGLINLLPLPLLDGGHLMFQLAEAIKGKPVSLTTKGYVYGFGLIFLLLAVFIINLNDFLTLLKDLLNVR